MLAQPHPRTVFGFLTHAYNSNSRRISKNCQKGDRRTVTGAAPQVSPSLAAHVVCRYQVGSGVPTEQLCGFLVSTAATIP